MATAAAVVVFRARSRVERMFILGIWLPSLGIDLDGVDERIPTKRIIWTSKVKRPDFVSGKYFLCGGGHFYSMELSYKTIFSR